MTFEVQVGQVVAPSVRASLSELVGNAAIRETADGLVVLVEDQAALVGLIARLNDLGLVIAQVTSHSRLRPA